MNQNLSHQENKQSQCFDRPVAKSLRIKNRVRLSVLIAGVGLLLAGRGTAQPLTTLHSFTGGDGASPYAGVLLAGNALYGTTYQGGSGSNGTVFMANMDGSGFVTLHNFTAFSGSAATNNDGANPYAGLILSGDTLYGTTTGGGNGFGTAFKMNTNGGGFTVLHTFASGEGAGPGGVVLAGSTLYGTTYIDGDLGSGTLFKVNADGTGFAILHNFAAINNGTNADGANPYPNAGLIPSGSSLYGTTSAGGASGNGTVFQINTNGTGFTVLHAFTAFEGSNSTNGDGGFPEAGLILSGNTLYGTASIGGTSGNGTLFKINTDATGFTTLYSFTSRSGPAGTNGDGAYPYGGLILSGDVLYGSAFGGGNPGFGTIFSISTNGTNFKTMYSLTDTNGDGANPAAGLVMTGSALYGTGLHGGDSGHGSIFKILIHPAFFTGENALGNGVYYLQSPGGNLFGYYTYYFFPYLYHYDLGFEYFFDANDGQGSAYFYDFTSGHFWYARPSLFPNLYDFSLNSWIYYFPDTQHAGHYTTNPRYFYNYTTGKIITQ